MALPASVAAVVILSAVTGILGVLLSELFSRLFTIHGDTQIDLLAGATMAVTITVVIATLLFT